MVMGSGEELAFAGVTRAKTVVEVGKDVVGL